MVVQTVVLRSGVPDKPPMGTPCNGCGVCCAAETCPAGRLRFLRRAGPCPALQWDEAGCRYRCGLISAPGRYFPYLSAELAGALARHIARRIAAGEGCDSDAQVED